MITTLALLGAGVWIVGAGLLVAALRETEELDAATCATAITWPVSLPLLYVLSRALGRLTGWS